MFGLNHRLKPKCNSKTALVCKISAMDKPLPSLIADVFSGQPLARASGRRGDQLARFRVQSLGGPT